MRVFRVRSNGEIYDPFRNRQDHFVLADPKHEREKHYAKNEVFADSLSEVIELVIKHGFHLWMKGNDTGQQNLIFP